MKSLLFRQWTKIWQIFHVILETQISFPSNFASIFSAIKCNSSVLYSAQKLYTLIKKSPLKCPFLRLLNARVKICQIPHVNFETTSQFLFKFCIILIAMTHNSSVNFKLIHFLLWIKPSQQSPNFKTFECSSKNLPNWSCHFPNHKSVFLQILHHFSCNETELLCTFIAQALYTLFKRSSLKCKFLRLTSARVKLLQIPDVSFETASQLVFK